MGGVQDPLLINTAQRPLRSSHARSRIESVGHLQNCCKHAIFPTADNVAHQACFRLPMRLRDEAYRCLPLEGGSLRVADNLAEPRWRHNERMGAFRPLDLRGDFAGRIRPTGITFRSWFAAISHPTGLQRHLGPSHCRRATTR